MPKIVSLEEMGQKLEIVKHYMALPQQERGRYAKSVGASRSAISYWKKTYMDDSHAMVEAMARECAIPDKTAKENYEVGHLELKDGMRVISVTVRDLDRIHYPRQVSVPAELKCGAIALGPLTQLAQGCIDVLSEWGYKTPTVPMMRTHIKALWR